MLLSFPIGVAAAIYLEEFAPRNRWTDLIEVNINNLAAVPSIVFGLLGLAVFINFFGLPRSAPLVGALVLTLLTLPTIIIASRAALKAVPPSIREAALGIGASKMQMVMHHVLPLAMPGMLTGTIIGMARALGETAPLLMIGMVAFIVDIPKGVTDPATALPVQIYLWSDSPERAFVERTSGAIIVLLAFLVVMNAAAVILRKRFEAPLAHRTKSLGGSSGIPTVRPTRRKSRGAHGHIESRASAAGVRGAGSYRNRRRRHRRQPDHSAAATSTSITATSTRSRTSSIDIGRERGARA